MKDYVKVTALFTIGFLLVGSSSTLLTASEESDLLVRTQLQVRPEGEFMVTTYKQGDNCLTINQATGEANQCSSDILPLSDTLSPPGIRWVIDDGSLNYIPEKVELGGRGTIAFYGCEWNNERTRLFSTTTTSPADALVWEDPGLQGAYADINIDASEDGNVLVAIAQFPPTDDETRDTFIPSLFKYTSNNASPDWVYTFPHSISAHSFVKVSKDGKYIAAVYYNDIDGRMEITYFSSDSEVPLFIDSFPSDYLRWGAFDMTDDGRLLYISGGTTVYIYDTKIQSILFSLDSGTDLECYAMSGNGKRFAYGGDNFVAWFQWNGTTYEFQDTYVMGGPVHCVDSDLSADAGTLAATFWGYENYLDFRVVSVDAITGEVNFEADFSGSGNLLNYPYQIVVNEDGSRIVYGGWGDQGNTNPEVMVFDRNNPRPIAWIDTRGSVFGVDISGDGVFVVSGSKSNHANQWGNGGDHANLYMGGQDLYLEGVPSLSNNVKFNVEGTPGENVLLGASLNEVDIPTHAGTLVVDRENYVQLGRGIIPQSGFLEMEVNVPGALDFLGQKVVTQALLNGIESPHLTNGQVFWILP